MFSEEEIKVLYKEKMGKELNLNNPKDLNEKIQWLNLYKQSELKTKCADKYMMREYIKEKGLYDYLPKLLGVYNNSKEIDFDNLPNKFVLKCNHASGQRFYEICKDKSLLNKKEVCEKLDKGLKEDYSLRFGEFHYSKIIPKIICEEFLEDRDNDIPKDYKLFCINGKPQFFEVCTNRNLDLTFSLYDLDWNNINDKLSPKRYNNKKIEKPKSLNEIIHLAENLSQDFELLRVDFFEINGRPVIGELTFTPAAGHIKTFSEDFLRELGEKVIINN